MVRHDVQHLPKPRLAQPRAKTLVGGCSAELFIDRLVIHHIVAMLASRRGLQVRRAVHMRDAKLAEILCDGGRIVKGKVFMQL